MVGGAVVGSGVGSGVGASVAVATADADGAADAGALEGLPPQAATNAVTKVTTTRFARRAGIGAGPRVRNIGELSQMRVGVSAVVAGNRVRGCYRQKSQSVATAIATSTAVKNPKVSRGPQGFTR